MRAFVKQNAVLAVGMIIVAAAVWVWDEWGVEERRTVQQQEIENARQLQDEVDERKARNESEARIRELDPFLRERAKAPDGQGSPRTEWSQ
jgi:uncharacterized membrane protein